MNSLNAGQNSSRRFTIQSAEHWKAVRVWSGRIMSAVPICCVLKGESVIFSRISPLAWQSSRIGNLVLL